MAGSPRIEDLLAEAITATAITCTGPRCTACGPQRWPGSGSSSGPTSAPRPASAEPSSRARRTTATDRPPRPTHASSDSRAATLCGVPDAARRDVSAGRRGRPAEAGRAPARVGSGPPAAGAPRQRAKAHRRARGRSRRAASRRAWRPSRPARRDVATAPAPISASHTTAGPCTPPRRGDRGFDVRRWRCAVPRGSRRAHSSRSTLRACSAGLGAARDRAGARQLYEPGGLPEGAGPGGGNRAPRVRRPCARGERTVADRPAPLFHRRPAAPWPRKIRRRRSPSLGAMADAPAQGMVICMPSRHRSRAVGR
jgi:hypothetical protein